MKDRAGNGGARQRGVSPARNKDSYSAEKYRAVKRWSGGLNNMIKGSAVERILGGALLYSIITLVGNIVGGTLGAIIIGFVLYTAVHNMRIIDETRSHPTLGVLPASIVLLFLLPPSPIYAKKASYWLGAISTVIAGTIFGTEKVIELLSSLGKFEFYLANRTFIIPFLSPVLGAFAGWLIKRSEDHADDLYNLEGWKTALSEPQVLQKLERIKRLGEIRIFKGGGSLSALGELSRFSEDEDWRVRCYAFFVMSQRPSQFLGECLVEGLKDDDSRVRATAAKAISNASDYDGLLFSTRQRRLNVRKILDKMAMALEEVKNDKESQVRDEIIKALDKINFSKALSRPPYLKISERTRQNQKSLEFVDKMYDFFVSYKVEDVFIVRQIVEQLIASGLKVWFAEYTILLSGRSETEMLNQAMDDGIEQAKFGICFTNNRYIQSLNCRHELTQLLDQKNCGPQNTIEIKLPDEPLPHQEFPQLVESPSIEYRDINQTLHYIRQISRFPIKSMDSRYSSLQNLSVFYYDQNTYSLDLTGWIVTHQESSLAQDIYGNVSGPTFKRMCDQTLMWGYLIMGKQDRDFRRDKLKDNNGNYDDTRYHDYMINFARHVFAERQKQECVGVHLVFIEHFSHSHSAFTTFIHGIWSRVYSIILPNPQNDQDQDIEFLFNFFFNGSFQEFCRHAHLMDKVVQSFRSI